MQSFLIAALLLGLTQAQQMIPKCEFTPVKVEKGMTVITAVGIVDGRNVSLPFGDIKPTDLIGFTIPYRLIKHKDFEAEGEPYGEYVFSSYGFGGYATNNTMAEVGMMITPGGEHLVFAGGGKMLATEPPYCFIRPLIGGTGRWLGANGICYFKMIIDDYTTFAGRMYARCIYKSWDDEYRGKPQGGLDQWS